MKGNSAQNESILISMYITEKNSGLNNFKLPFPIFENKTKVPIKNACSKVDFGTCHYF